MADPSQAITPPAAWGCFTEAANLSISLAAADLLRHLQHAGGELYPLHGFLMAYAQLWEAREANGAARADVRQRVFLWLTSLEVYDIREVQLAWRVVFKY